MPKVIKRDNEEIDSMLARFKKQVRSAGILEDCRKKEFFIPRSLRRKIKAERARKLNRKRK